MSLSPKRKHDTTSPSLPSTKKARLSNGSSDDDDTMASPVPILPPTTAAAAPDSQINTAAALAYWSSTEATVNGVLGGFPQVSRIDLQGSSNFLAKLRRQSAHHPPSKGKLSRAVDCGAGIGRITEGFLTNVAEVVDIVEPVVKFTDVVKGRPGVGRVFNVGLEDWPPQQPGGGGEDVGTYDLIWTQWCVGQLTDAQLVAYLRRLPKMLSRGGWVVIKENLSNHHLREDVYDETDSSVTRTDAKFKQLFAEAGWRIVSTELQKGMPQGLYPVRAYALQPR